MPIGSFANCVKSCGVSKRQFIDMCINRRLLSQFVKKIKIKIVKNKKLNSAREARICDV